jgi:hypothetical protein
MTSDRDDTDQRPLDKRLAEVRIELEKMAGEPPMQRDSNRWRELVALEAELIVRVRQNRA